MQLVPCSREGIPVLGVLEDFEISSVKIQNSFFPLSHLKKKKIIFKPDFFAVFLPASHFRICAAFRFVGGHLCFSERDGLLVKAGSV